MEPRFTVAICGGGNLAHGCIAAIGQCNPDWKINLFSRRPQVWHDTITGYTKGSAWESRGDLKGKINICSDNPKKVVENADIIIICSPAHTKNEIIRQIKPYIKDGTLIGSVFGQGAFDCQVIYGLGNGNHSDGLKVLKQKSLTVFCLQYVPFICKAVNYGKDINIIGPKKMLYCVAYPIENVHYVCSAMSQAFYLPSVPIPSFMNLVLCPSNQIIHPGRVTGFFGKFPEKANKVLKFKDVPLLYEGLDQVSADQIQGLDNEIQAIKKAILKRCPDVNLDQVMPISERIKTMYNGQISDTSSLKRIFNTNIGYSRVPFPMLPVEGQDLQKTKKEDVKVKLNVNARFFWEDVPYGLVILKDIGNMVGVKTPKITEHIIFHQQYMPVKYVDEKTGEFHKEVLLKATGAPSAYGIKTLDQLVKTSMSASTKFMSENIYFRKPILPLARL